MQASRHIVARHERTGHRHVVLVHHRLHHLGRDRLLAGGVAGRKGHSFFGYFLLSLLFFPLAIIMAYAVEDRTLGAYS